jgi:hypothetical protein
MMVIGDEENWRLLYWRAGDACSKPPTLCRNDYPSFLACWEELDRMTLTRDLDPKDIVGLSSSMGRYITKESLTEIAWRQDYSAEDVLAKLVQQ